MVIWFSSLSVRRSENRIADKLQARGWAGKLKIIWLVTVY